MLRFCCVTAGLFEDSDSDDDLFGRPTRSEPLDSAPAKKVNTRPLEDDDDYHMGAPKFSSSESEHLDSTPTKKAIADDVNSLGVPPKSRTSRKSELLVSASQKPAIPAVAPQEMCECLPYRVQKTEIRTALQQRLKKGDTW